MCNSCIPNLIYLFYFFPCGFSMWLNHTPHLYAYLSNHGIICHCPPSPWPSVMSRLFSKVQTELWPDVVCSTSDERNYNYFMLCHCPSVPFYCHESCYGRCTDVSIRCSEWVALGNMLKLGNMLFLIIFWQLKQGHRSTQTTRRWQIDNTCWTDWKKQIILLIE